jgi:phage gp16-like protein
VTSQHKLQLITDREKSGTKRKQITGKFNRENCVTVALRVRDILKRSTKKKRMAQNGAE